MLRLGQLSSVPVGWGSVLRNVLLLAAAAAIAVTGPASAGPSMVAWVTRIPVTSLTVLAGGAVITGVIAAESWLLAHVLRQNRRLWLRLEPVEGSLARAGGSQSTGSAHSACSPHAGPPVGVPAPPFHLDRLDGGTTSSTDLLAPGAVATSGEVGWP
jgi:hypothetical protein